MAHMRYLPLLGLLALLGACASGAGYHDNMGNSGFAQRCAFDMRRKYTALSWPAARKACHCQYDGLMRAYGNSVAAVELDYRANRADLDRVLDRVTHDCVSQALRMR